MQLIKRLTQTLSAGSTTLTFTDSMINNNSVIEVYADSIDVYPTALSQSGTSVTAQFDAQLENHSILLLINNIVSLSDPELATLLDVDLGTLNEDDILTYDETADKWVNTVLPTPPTPDASEVEYDNSDSGLSADNVQEAIDEVFQSVSDGKELIADAITDKGVPTSATDTFATMAQNISDIPTSSGYANIVEDIRSWTPSTTQPGVYIIWVTNPNAHSDALYWEVLINGQSDPIRIDFDPNKPYLVIVRATNNANLKSQFGLKRKSGGWYGLNWQQSNMNLTWNSSVGRIEYYTSGYYGYAYLTLQ